MRVLRLAVLTAVAGALAGCQADFGSSCRRVAGPYCLEQWEDGQTYYLNDRTSETNDGGGAIDGTAQRIAWTGKLILVERRSIFRGDPDGWMAIDVMKRNVRGLITDAEARAIFNRENIEPFPAADAWRRLGAWTRG